ncbi:hypothetical protein BsWGS_16974 [Bradybaena similaris]
MSKLKEATEEELQQVDEEGRPYKMIMGQKVILRRIKLDPEEERRRQGDDSGDRYAEVPVMEGPYQLDTNFMSRSVVSLNKANFDEYLKTKEKALVYFYDANAGRKHGFREYEFARASDKSTHYNYGFAGVDCFYDRSLCDQEMIKPEAIPVLKLYSNGFEVSHIECHMEFNSDQMLMLMKMTPILTKPKVETGKELAAKTVEPCKKKKKFGLFG